MKLKVFLDKFDSWSEFDKYLNLSYEVIEPGYIKYRMPIKKDFLATPDAAHGGIIAAFMDSVLGMAALTMSVPEDKLVSTVEFKLNFLRPALLGDSLIGVGKVEYNGTSICTSTAHIYKDEGLTELVAQGMGTFNKYPISKKGL